MVKDKIVLVKSPRWQAIYINGHKVLSAEVITASQLLYLLDHTYGDVNFREEQVPTPEEYVRTEYYDNGKTVDQIDPYDKVYFPTYLPEIT